MKAHLIQPGQLLGEAVDVDDDFRSLQQLVGGYVTRVQLRPDVMALVDEDGPAKRLRVNHAATLLCRGRIAVDEVLVGPCLVVGVDGESIAPLPVAWRDR